ncbi:hypothetical protein E0H75_42195 [Kribbella capetownensis]|uniref:Uncharacterized protein n=1 Tax=Kribbella capetownensis TaxID=1572659 RepID=A0A4V6N441_9ACTN|nr:hypothetical protein [Kribbella capetownensis]TCC33872.1 hypothetical protein E0H75_42195 [Kribbella capetownensis]
MSAGTTTTATTSVTIADLFAEVQSIESVFGAMGWAEDEIEQAQLRHPGATDAIWHSFSLLTPVHPLMQRSEPLFRAYCREILDRVAAGSDTRPGTAAEICCVASEASEKAPLTSPAFGLYARAFRVVFPDQQFPGEEIRDGAYMEHVEALHGAAIDDIAADTRRRLTRKDRTLTGIECAGLHHGEPVECRYRPTQGHLFVA